ncbi:MAG TPA: hypothetical protein VGI77_05325 [Gaiellaceae bacterium]|jgi:hypothetical protein
MRRLKAFGFFWWDFVVGDDWIAAVCVVAAIAATAAIASTNVPSWWLMPVAVSGTLYLTLRRALHS